jgi:peptide/nickel transport system permease protein
MMLFAGRRILQALPILLGVSLIVFSLAHLVPGDAIDLLLPPEASADTVARLKAELGYDKPVFVQFLYWLLRALHGNLGVSVFSGRPVIDEVLTALGNTLQLALPATVIGFAAGIALGLLAGFHGGTWLDKLFSATAITGVSLPHYWFAILMVLVFSVELNVLPAQGMAEDAAFASWEQIRHMILPVVTLSLIPMGVVARLTRACVQEILSQEFVSALRAKGLTSRPVLWHVVKNAAPPVLSVMGLQFGYLLGGSILVETVYNWPGSGNLLNLAIFRRDVPVLQATILLLAFFFVVVNLGVDILQAAIDPRIRR